MAAPKKPSCQLTKFAVASTLPQQDSFLHCQTNHDGNNCQAHLKTSIQQVSEIILKKIVPDFTIFATVKQTFNIKSALICGTQGGMHPFAFEYQYDLPLF
jgi:hypothetical protein